MNRTVLLGLFVFSVLVACNCSDYFTPWTAFQKPDLDPNRYPPDLSAARALNLGDSIGPINLGQGKINWYTIQAKKDSTYVILLYQQFYAEYALVNSGDFANLVSGSGYSYNRTPLIIWTCDTSDTVYLRIAGASSSDSGSYRLAMKNFQTVYGGSADPYEPDSRGSREEIYTTSPGNAEMYSIRMLTPGDTDWFYFSVYGSGTYTIKTVGNTDTKICLLSDNGDSVVATDDNSGGGMNAKLSMATAIYSYFNRTFYVTGGTAGASGAYGISIRYSY
jgi:hypothetical protein